jgi:hypothetical protein
MDKRVSTTGGIILTGETELVAEKYYTASAVD